jgi:hypothetical protein
MGSRALEFSRAHPDGSPGYTAALAELEQQLARAEQLATQQRQGVVEVRAATARKRDLRRSIRQRLLVHVARAARGAAREVPELTQRFALPREPIPYLTFRTLARNVADEAQQRKELLVKYGLVEQLLVSLLESLDQFDQAMTQAAEGRRMHIAAGVELDVVADEVVDIVQVFDGLNRFRFAGDPDLFAAWRSASNVIGPAKRGGRSEGRINTPSEKPPESPPSGGEIKPAA